MELTHDTEASWRALVEAREQEHKADVAKLRMQLVLYRQALLDAGIEPPDMDGEDLLELWRSHAAVVSTASQVLMSMGTAKELLMKFGSKG